MTNKARAQTKQWGPNQLPRQPLDSTLVAMARAMAINLIDTARKTHGNYQSGDLVLKHFVGPAGTTDLLIVLGDRDALDRIVAFSRTLGTEAQAWAETTPDAKG